MQILSTQQIKHKIDRLAYEVLENNFQTKDLIFAGINNNGLAFAKKLKKVYDSISEQSSILANIKLNPASPSNHEIEFDTDVKNLNNKSIIIVDDVANTGRTIFYAAKPIMDFLPKKVQVAVLVDRKHKTFPIKVDYVGLSLATTLKENIVVDISNAKTMAVHLE